MSTSPAWLTIALTALSSVPDSPATVVATGIRHLPSPHILNHLNRWARHVWRPAVSPRPLSALTSTPAREPLAALGTGAVSLFAALVEAVRRCNVADWLDVLGVMFLADDPWAIDVGRDGNAEDVDRAVAAMRALYDQPGMVSEVSAQLTAAVREFEVDDVEVGTSGGGQESFAELRCRVAALQLQLDDVTAVVRRNEKNTKDLLSSFHFWSLLLLDELRSYRSQERGPGSTADGVFESLSKRMGQIMNRPSGGTGSAAGSASDLSRESASAGGESSAEGAQGRERVRPKRVFRDGKWVVL